MTRTSKSLIFPFLLVLYEIAIYLSNDMYLPAVPEMMAELGLTTQHAQLTLTCWFAGAASLPLFMGAITDRFGRRPVLLSGGVIYIAATVACAISPNFWMLIIARFIEGGAMSSMLVPGYACIHESYDQKHAIRILALMSSITVLAPALGPLLGAVILLVTSWRGIFWIIASLAIVSILLLYVYMPETLQADKRQSIHLGRLFSHYGSMVKNKLFMSNVMTLGFVFCGFLAWVTTAPLLVMHSFHYSAINFGLIQSLVFVVYILANRSVKYFIEWIGISLLVRLGLSLSLAGGLLAVLAGILIPFSLAGFVAAMTLYSLGSGLNAACLNRLAVDACPEQPMGVKVALFTVFITGFSSLGTVLASLFFNGSTLSLAGLLCASIGIACLMKWLGKA